MPPSIEQYLIDFEPRLVQQNHVMNLNDDAHLPPFSPSRRPGGFPSPFAGFSLPTPLSSSSSKDEEIEAHSRGPSMRAEDEC